MRGFGWKTWRKNTAWRIPELMGEHIKIDFKKFNWRVWIGLIWLRIRSSARLLIVV
jgi:hypothetical protein